VSVTLLLGGTLSLDVEGALALLDTYPAPTLRVYDRGPSSGTDTVGPAEIGRLIVIEPLSRAAAAGLVSAAAEAPWHLVPSDAKLADADPEGDLYWDAARLYDHFDQLHGVGHAIASKLLYLKRSAFFPILDRVVRDFYDDQARHAYQRSERGRRELPRADRLYWAAVRDDLVLAANRTALGDLRSALATSDDQHRRGLAVVSDVRLVDMIVWRSAYTSSA
jgi:hypothetical protein